MPSVRAISDQTGFIECKLSYRRLIAARTEGSRAIVSVPRERSSLRTLPHAPRTSPSTGRSRRAPRSRKRDLRGGLTARLAMRRYDGRIDAAAYVEASGEPHEARRHCGNQVLEDFVGDCFMECAAIAERPDVELERLELHAGRIRNILEFECRKIRLSGARAQARELRDRHPDRVIALALRVGECLERRARLRTARRRAHEGPVTYRTNSEFTLHYAAIVNHACRVSPGTSCG